MTPVAPTPHQPATLPAGEVAHLTQDERIAMIERHIRTVPDFPNPGVSFKDITPLLADPQAYQASIEALAEVSPEVDVVIGMEARGFLFAAPLALRLGVGFVPVRKPGKLPLDVYSETFALEYGQATLTVHQDAIQPGARVLVVDDVLATGGTIGATSRLIRHLGAELVHVNVLIELSFLEGRKNLEGMGIDDITALITA